VRCEPSFLDLGSNYPGALVEGSFLVSPAGECREVFEVTG
jgi:hypothetical protein